MKKTTTVLLLVLVTVAAAAAQKLEKANPVGLSKPAPGTYTQIVRAGKLLFIAGQTGTNAEGKVVGPGMKEQVDQVFANLLTALKSQGADFSHVVKMTTYVTSISEFRSPDVAAVRARHVGANPPANTLVEIQQRGSVPWKPQRNDAFSNRLKSTSIAQPSSAFCGTSCSDTQRAGMHLMRRTRNYS